MSTLAVVEEILRETGVPMSVRQIVEHARGRLPTRSKTPDTVVARDLSMDIKRKGEGSLFERTEPGRYTLRSLRAHGESRGAQVPEAPVAVMPNGPTGPTEPTAVAGLIGPNGPTEPSEPYTPRAREQEGVTPGEDNSGRPMSIVSAAIRDERAGTLPARVSSTSNETKRDTTK